ncbi:MAG: ATP-binding cassette domain-containing protein [Polyangiaceae bacterium]|nr:ATP-binding cassette domain-containing protein [Polyangiaceae bacterium]
MSQPNASRPVAEAAVAVVAEGLVKRYGELVAVAGIDLRIRRGECFGFLGANGAGKTTTMRMVQAVSEPSGGTLRVLGLDPVRDGKQVRARLGVCAQEDNLDPDLTVIQNLLVYGSYFPQPRATTRQRAEELLAFVALEEKRDRHLRELSGGMKRRLMIARALMNDPELIVLDEPTTGLDPAARHLIWQKLRELAARGVTMLLTTHYMDEAERLCNRLVIMDRGRILAEDAPRALIGQHVGHEVVELRVPEVEEGEVLAGLDLEGITSERVGDIRVFFFERQSAAADRLVGRARSVDVACLVRNATLEDVFLKLTGRELNE